MGLTEAKEEFNKGLETPAQETLPLPEQTPTPQQKIEELAYYLGGKEFKVPTNAEFAIKHNGQLIKTPLEKMANAFRQSSHFEDRGKELKTLKDQYYPIREWADRNPQKWEKLLQTDPQILDKVLTIQSWSESSPKEWEKIWGLFQNKERVLLDPNAAQTQGDPQLLDKIAFLEKTLNEQRDILNVFQSEQQERLISHEEQKVLSEIESFKKEYPEVDLQEKNLDGVPLVSLIINHGIKEGIKKFHLAAMDYLGPRVTDLLQTRGRNEITKAVKRDTQQGIVSRSNTPFPGKSSGEVDPSKMSPQDRVRAAKAEFESAMAQTK